MEAVGSVVNGLIGDRSAKRAADTQSRAAAAALAEQRRQFDVTRGDWAPYREAGRNALQQLTALQNFDPTPTAEDVMAEPGYQFGLQQGRNALEGSAAASGGLYSGNALKALTRYGNDYATTKYNDAWNRAQTGFGNRWGRLGDLAGVGRSATQQVQQAGQNYANASGNIGISNARYQGAAGMERANIWGNALNSVISSGQRNSWWLPQSGGGGVNLGTITGADASAFW